jgi:chromosome segregation ATPase
MSMNEETKKFIESQNEKLATMIARGFSGVDKRFEGVDRKFEEVDRKFEQVDKKFKEMHERFDILEQRLDRMEKSYGYRIESLERDVAYLKT